jgi:methylated-DNA-protein-cysteine methyltransferase-like protein
MFHGQNLTLCRGVNGARQQAIALEAEGVQVTRGSLGEYTIDFTTYGWFPDRLPSDLSEDDDEEEDEE